MCAGFRRDGAFHPVMLLLANSEDFRRRITEIGHMPNLESVEVIISLWFSDR
jgi:hypothetical protein